MAQKMGANILFIPLLTSGCSGSEPEPPDSSGTNSPPGSSGTVSSSGEDVPRPTVWVVSPPEGFIDESPNELQHEWASILRSDECSLEARASIADGEVDMRAESVALLEAMATEDDASTESITDIFLTTEGAGEGNDPAGTITFAMASWDSRDGTVRGAARVANMILFDGTSVHQSLEFRFACSGDQVNETDWEEVIEGIRPMLHFDEEEPWQGTSDAS